MNTLIDKQFSFRTEFKHKYGEYAGKFIRVEGLHEYFGINEDNFDVTQDIIIDWELRTYSRSWGLECMTPEVTRVTGVIDWSIDAEYLTELEKEKLIAMGGVLYRDDTIGGILNIDSVEQHWQVGNDLVFDKAGGIQVNEVEIDFGERSILIQ
jgi:hypothetical protein